MSASHTAPTAHHHSPRDGDIDVHLMGHAWHGIQLSYNGRKNLDYSVAAVAERKEKDKVAGAKLDRLADALAVALAIALTVTVAFFFGSVFGGFFGLSAADGIALWLLPGGHATTVLSVAVLIQLPRDCFTGDRNRLVLARASTTLARRRRHPHDRRRSSLETLLASLRTPNA